MKDDRTTSDADAMLDPEDVNSPPTTVSSAATAGSDDSVGQRSMSGERAEPDPNDEVPVPIMMSAAEIDERAQAVEALRGADTPSPTGDQNLEA